MKSFSSQFLVVAWAFFFVTGRTLIGGLVLIMAGVYMLADVLPSIWKKLKNR